MARKNTAPPKVTAHPGTTVVQFDQGAAADSAVAMSADDQDLGDSTAPPLPHADETPRASGLNLMEVLDHISHQRLDVAAGLALAALARRDQTVVEESEAISAVIRGYQAALAAVPPMHGVPLRPIRPDERGQQALVEMCNLLRLQEGQLNELQATIAELL